MSRLYRPCRVRLLTSFVSVCVFFTSLLTQSRLLGVIDFLWKHKNSLEDTTKQEDPLALEAELYLHRKVDTLCDETTLNSCICEESKEGSNYSNCSMSSILACLNGNGNGKDQRSANAVQSPPTPEKWQAPQNLVDILAEVVTRHLSPKSLKERDFVAAVKLDGHCDIVQIIGNTTYFTADGNMKNSECSAWTSFPTENCTKPFLNDRRLATLRLIDASLKRWGPMNEIVEVVVCVGDGPVPLTPHVPMLWGALWPLSTCGGETKKSGRTGNAPSHLAAHVWTPIVCGGQSNIPYPLFVDRPEAEGSISSWDRIRNDTMVNGAMYPFASRDDKIVFRGGERSWYPDLVREDVLGGRQKLFHLGQEWPTGTDIGYEPLPLNEQERFKYIIYAEGHFGWADRLRLLLHMGTALLMQQTPCVEYYGLGLIPGVHMLPLDYRFRNIKDIYEFAAENPSYVQQMIENMHTYAEEVLSEDKVLLYTHLLLRKQLQALAYRCKPRFPRYTAQQVEALLSLNASTPMKEQRF